MLIVKIFAFGLVAMNVSFMYQSESRFTINVLLDERFIYQQLNPLILKL